jgi:hypothetical protein
MRPSSAVTSAPSTAASCASAPRTTVRIERGWTVSSSWPATASGPVSPVSATRTVTGASVGLPMSRRESSPVSVDAPEKTARVTGVAQASADRPA